jgi:predicted nucleotidyltransferase
MLLEELLGSKTRAAIVERLFSDGARKVHVRELARMSGLSAPSLMREAKALVRTGVLVEEKEQNRILYSANAACPFSGALKELVRKMADGTARLAAAFAGSGFDVVFIYGSRANGKARADSDYDVFCIGDEGLRKTSARLATARERLGVEINPYVVSRGEFRRRFAAEDHFIREVMAQPKVFLKGGADELGAMAQ